jgi:hypothetical protein
LGSLKFLKPGSEAFQYIRTHSGFLSKIGDGNRPRKSSNLGNGHGAYSFFAKKPPWEDSGGVDGLLRHDAGTQQQADHGVDGIGERFGCGLTGARNDELGGVFGGGDVLC